MSKIKTHEEISVEEMNEAEERYIDDLELISKAFEKDLKFRPEAPGDALDQAIQEAKGVDESVRAALSPVPDPDGMMKSYTKMVNLMTDYLIKSGKEFQLDIENRKEIDDLMAHTHLAKNSTQTLGQNLDEWMSNRDFTSMEKVKEVAFDLMLGTMAVENSPYGIYRNDVQPIIKQAGQNAIKHGLDILKDTENFEAFKEQAKNFRNAAQKLEVSGFEPK